MEESGGRARFTGRMEYFGSIFFNRDQGILVPFDHLGTAIFQALGEHSLQAVRKAFKADITGEDFDSFVEKWQSEGLIDESGHFCGEFLPDRSCDGFLSAPLKIYLDFTYGCNLRCVHCLTSSGSRAEGELDTYQMKAVLKEMSEAGVFELNVGGGEPLMRRDALELLHDASRLGFSTHLLTNGTMVDEKMARALGAVELRSIAISLDGATMETHDAIRGKGAFKKALRALELLSTYTGHSLYLHMTLMRRNLGELRSFLALAGELPVHSSGVSFVRYQGRTKSGDDMLLSADEYKKALHDSMECMKVSGKPFFVKSFLPGADEDGSSRLYTGFGCGAAQVNCSLDASGNLIPCNFFDVTGRKENILEKGLIAIWQHGMFFRELRNLHGNKKCLSCEHFRDCRGGCRAQAEQLFGDLNAPDHYCLKEST